MKGDPNDLRQILVNILLNAIEAMPAPGEILISGQVCSTQENSAGLSRKEENQTVLCLSIKDRGKGMKSAPNSSSRMNC